MPLRVRLIAAMVALVAAALAAISIGGISVLRGYLLGQSDNQLPALASQSTGYVADYLVTTAHQTGTWTRGWPGSRTARSHWADPPGHRLRPARQLGRRCCPTPTCPPARPGWTRTRASR